MGKDDKQSRMGFFDGLFKSEKENLKESQEFDLRSVDEFSRVKAETGLLRIGDILIQHGKVTKAQVDDALRMQKEVKTKRLGECLMDLGYLEESCLLEVLSKVLGISIIDWDLVEVDLNLCEIIPKELADKYTMLPLKKLGRELQVVVNNPLDFEALAEIREYIVIDIVQSLAEKEIIQEKIQMCYADYKFKKALENVLGDEGVPHYAEFKESEYHIVESEEDVPIVKLVNGVLVKGYMLEATDIHIEPYEKDIIIRMRIDGGMWEYVKLPKSNHAGLVARLKVISGLDIAEKRLPQDGNFKYKVDGINFNIRTSVLPTVFGEKVVLRYMDMKSTIMNESTFGMLPEDYKKCRRLLQKPHGCIYISGATGSGKTTTLYSFLDSIIKKPVSVVSVEDPVERKIRGVAQVQVNPAAGLTFAVGLRSILRQDPDVIMIGETRDEETAQIAVRAAITGHLVLSTIHTNSAISIIARLSDMGIPLYMLADSLEGLIAQRLIRKICEECKEEYEPGKIELSQVSNVDKFYRGRGCDACNNSGYKGRIAVHEVVELDNEVRGMILRKEALNDIRNYCAVNKNMVVLDETIKKHIRAGITTVSELVRVGMVDADIK